MKAVTYEKYGGPEVLRFKEVEKPAPGDNEALVKVHAASVNAADWHLLTADIFLVRLSTGLFKPKNQILGGDIAGTIGAVGGNVRQFRPGDDVFGEILGKGNGGFAEYVSVPENTLVRKPVNLSFEEAAAVPLASVTALQGLRDLGEIQSGQSVLINGASGGVGTFAVQIAKAFGAEVTAVCSTGNLQQARSLGADHVIDYTSEDFTKAGKQYDLIFGANSYRPLSAYMRALSPQGTFVMSGGSMARLFQAMLLGPWISKKGGRKVRVLSAKANQQDLAFIRDLVEAGKVAPVIDQRYRLSETADALRYLGAGHAHGKVVVTVGTDT